VLFAPFKHNAPQAVMLDPTFQLSESQENTHTVEKSLVNEKIRTLDIKIRLSRESSMIHAPDPVHQFFLLWLVVPHLLGMIFTRKRLANEEVKSMNKVRNSTTQVTRVFALFRQILLFSA
jgi:hypothetical protein